MAFNRPTTRVSKATAERDYRKRVEAFVACSDAFITKQSCVDRTDVEIISAIKAVRAEEREKIQAVDLAGVRLSRFNVPPKHPDRPRVRNVLPFFGKQPVRTSSGLTPDAHLDLVADLLQAKVRG